MASISVRNTEKRFGKILVSAVHFYGVITRLIIFLLQVQIKFLLIISPDFDQYILSMITILDDLELKYIV